LSLDEFYFFAHLLVICVFVVNFDIMAKDDQIKSNFVKMQPEIHDFELDYFIHYYIKLLVRLFYFSTNIKRLLQ